MELTAQQARVLKGLRQGINGVIGNIPRDEERRAACLVNNKAEDIECLLDLVDELRSKVPPPSPTAEDASQAPPDAVA